MGRALRHTDAELRSYEGVEVDEGSSCLQDAMVMGSGNDHFWTGNVVGDETNHCQS